MAMTVPTPTRCQHNVPGLHRMFLAIHHRERPFAFDNHPQRMWRVAMRARLLARQDHLIGIDQRLSRSDVVAWYGVTQDQVSPLRQVSVDKPPGSVERGAAFVVLPVHRLERRVGFFPEDRRFPVDPARRHLKRRQRRVQLVKVASGAKCGDLVGTDSVSIHLFQFSLVGPPPDCAVLRKYSLW